MNLTRRSLAATALVLASPMAPLLSSVAHADDREKLAAKGVESLHLLEQTEPRARFFARHAQAALVFPSILTGGSWGLQVGGQDFSYVLFFMTPDSLDYLRKSDGFSAGTGPSITVINQGAAAAADTTTVSQDVVAFPFNGRGLMADLTLQGTKITRIHPR
jgi:lipid-binding SYLF domain-containing protein